MQDSRPKSTSQRKNLKTVTLVFIPRQRKRKVQPMTFRCNALCCAFKRAQFSDSFCFWTFPPKINAAYPIPKNPAPGRQHVLQSQAMNRTARRSCDFIAGLVFSEKAAFRRAGTGRDKTLFDRLLFVTHPSLSLLAIRELQSCEAAR